MKLVRRLDLDNLFPPKRTLCLELVTGLRPEERQLVYVLRGWVLGFEVNLTMPWRRRLSEDAWQALID